MATVPASPRAVLLNWLWLLIAQVGVRLIALGYAVFLTRTLGPEQYGQFSWVVATVMLLSMLPEAGLNRLIIRDIGRDTAAAPALLGVLTRLRLGLGLVTFVVMLVGFLAFDLVENPARRMGLYIVGLLLIVRAPLFTFDAAYYGVEQTRYSGISQVLVTLVGAVLGVGLILAGGGLSGVFIAMVAAHLVQAVYLYRALPRVGLAVEWRARLPSGPLLRSALPYALLAVLGMIYFRIDTVMLGVLRGDTGDHDAGIYTAAFKLLEVLMFVPGTLAALLLPRMARYHDNDTERLRASHTRLTRLLLVLAVPISAFVWIESAWIIGMLFGAPYAESIPVLRLLALTFLFHCLHTPNATLVLSGKVLGAVVWLSVYTAGCNVILNWLFIPTYGANAAAATTLASEIISWIVFTGYIHMRVVKLGGLLSALMRPAVGAAVAGGVLLLSGEPRPMTLALAGGAYCVAVILSGGLTREDLSMLRRASPAPAIELEPESS